jgi:hypothetical protein
MVAPGKGIQLSVCSKFFMPLLSMTPRVCCRCHRSALAANQQVECYKIADKIRKNIAAKNKVSEDYHEAEDKRRRFEASHKNWQKLYKEYSTQIEILSKIGDSENIEKVGSLLTKILAEYVKQFVRKKDRRLELFEKAEKEREQFIKENGIADDSEKDKLNTEERKKDHEGKISVLVEKITSIEKNIGILQENNSSEVEKVRSSIFDEVTVYAEVLKGKSLKADEKRKKYATQLDAALKNAHILKKEKDALECADESSQSQMGGNSERVYEKTIENLTIDEKRRLREEEASNKLYRWVCPLLEGSVLLDSQDDDIKAGKFRMKYLKNMEEEKKAITDCLDALTEEVRRVTKDISSHLSNKTQLQVELDDLEEKRYLLSAELSGIDDELHIHQQRVSSGAEVRTAKDKYDGELDEGELNTLLQFDADSGSLRTADVFADISGWTPRITDKPVREDVYQVLDFLASVIAKMKGGSSKEKVDKKKEKVGEEEEKVGEEVQSLRWHLAGWFLNCEKPTTLNLITGMDDGYAERQLSQIFSAFRKRIVQHFQENNLPEEYVKKVLRRRYQRYLRVVVELLLDNTKKVPDNFKLFLEYYREEVDVLKKVIPTLLHEGSNCSFGTCEVLSAGLKKLKKTRPENYKLEIVEAVREREMGNYLKELIANTVENKEHHENIWKSLIEAKILNCIHGTNLSLNIWEDDKISNVHYLDVDRKTVLKTVIPEEEKTKKLKTQKTPAQIIEDDLKVVKDLIKAYKMKWRLREWIADAKTEKHQCTRHEAVVEKLGNWLRNDEKPWFDYNDFKSKWIGAAAIDLGIVNGHEKDTLKHEISTIITEKIADVVEKDKLKEIKKERKLILEVLGFAERTLTENLQGSEEDPHLEKIRRYRIICWDKENRLLEDQKEIEKERLLNEEILDLVEKTTTGKLQETEGVRLLEKIQQYRIICQNKENRRLEDQKELQLKEEIHELTKNSQVRKLQDSEKAQHLEKIQQYAIIRLKNENRRLEEIQQFEVVQRQAVADVVSDLEKQLQFDSGKLRMAWFKTEDEDDLHCILDSLLTDRRLEEKRLEDLLACLQINGFNFNLC